MNLTSGWSKEEDQDLNLPHRLSERSIEGPRQRDTDSESGRSREAESSYYSGELDTDSENERSSIAGSSTKERDETRAESYPNKYAGYRRLVHLPFADGL